ncbi:hypothetical protein [Methylomonas albis]|uniref:Restriction endonuclease n=1 Tax=Methylomonas albis TaxID=1854563 RepID=A0ABR9CWE5_9GAMM|nr:hypothetical protein [Methylomonas albis]MBD9355198.1 hypothetical protein [Methylomonas albis]
MSLTRELAKKNSLIRKFFAEHELKSGLHDCLKLLQSDTPLILPETPHSSAIVYAWIGTTVDYLIRYTANGNKLNIAATIAAEVVQRYKLKPKSYLNQPHVYHSQNLFKIGKKGLDGRNGASQTAIYAATALSILDHSYRAFRLPEVFETELIPGFTPEQKEIIRATEGKTLKEKTTNYLIGEFVTQLGGHQYLNDLSKIIQIFIDEKNNRNSALYQSEFIVFNQALKNSIYVGGADFDCVIKVGEYIVLTEIKTSIKKITTLHLYQLISYALLLDEKNDGFEMNSIGFYHSRSGSFRYLPIDIVIDAVLPGFRSLEQLREYFLRRITPEYLKNPIA